MKSEECGEWSCLRVAFGVKRVGRILAVLMAVFCFGLSGAFAETGMTVTLSPSKAIRLGVGETGSVKARVRNARGTVTYQWEYSTDNGKTWKEKAGETEATLKYSVTEKNYRKAYSSQFRCKVTDKKGTVTSSPVRIKAPLSVAVSPEKRTLDTGKTGTFKASVSGAEGTVSYQWQQSDDGGQTWTDTTIRGSRKATLSVKATSARYGLMFRCLVTAGNGKAASSPVWINPANWNHFKYRDNGKGQWIITRYKQDEAKVTVPAGYKGRRVTAIGEGVFRGKKLKTVAIPRSVTAIGAYAFENCAALTTVTLSDNVKTIGKAAFRNCGKLADMKIENK